MKTIEEMIAEWNKEYQAFSQENEIDDISTREYEEYVVHTMHEIAEQEWLTAYKLWAHKDTKGGWAKGDPGLILSQKAMEELISLANQYAHQFDTSVIQERIDDLTVRVKVTGEDLEPAYYNIKWVLLNDTQLIEINLLYDVPVLVSPIPAAIAAMFLT